MNEKLDTLNYWYKRNRSTSYPQKLNELFNSTARLLRYSPGLGSVFIPDKNIYQVRVRDYRLYYTFSKSELVILVLWDVRRNPQRFKL